MWFPKNLDVKVVSIKHHSYKATSPFGGEIYHLKNQQRLETKFKINTWEKMLQY